MTGRDALAALRLLLKGEGYEVEAAASPAAIQGGSGVNARKTLAGPKNTRSATRSNHASRLELPLLGSNQDSPGPERRLGCESRTYITYTNREIVSSACRESTSWMSDLVRVC
jgi:hypothetical protein